MYTKYTSCLLGALVLFSAACSRQENNHNHDHAELTQMEADEILISIDGNELTYGQAIRQVETRLGGPPPQGMDPERVAMIERRTFNAVVDDFIRRELLLAEARELGVEPKEEDIERAVREIEQRSAEGKTPSSMYYEGPDSLRREVTAGLTIEKLLAQKLPPFQHPSEAEIAAYLESNPTLRMHPAQAEVRHIFLAVPLHAEQEHIAELKENLQDTRQRLLDGADFAQTANIISQDGSAERGGHLGTILKGRSDPRFEEAVFNQPIGEIGPVVRSAQGLHIIQVMDRTEERPASQDDIIAHMRRKHRDTALNEYVRELMQRIEMRHSPAIRPLPSG